MADPLSRRQASEPACYASRGDDSSGHLQIQADGVQTPCGGSKTNVTSCCISGHRCTEDGICHFSDQTSDSSGYYIGGCTDSSFNDPACSRACIHYNQHDVVYNTTSGLWACCWNNAKQAIDCTDPTSQTFQAIAVNSLSDAPAYTPPSTTSSSSSASSSPTTSSSASSPPGLTALPSLTSATTSPSSGGLSSGAKAGIGVGSAIAGLIIFAALAFLALNRRKGRRGQHRMYGNAIEGEQEKHDTASPTTLGELPGNERDPELDGVPRSELDARARLDH